VAHTVPQTRPSGKHHHTDGHLRAIFARRDFRRLLISRVTSQLADGFFQAGLAVSVFFNPNSKIEPLAYAVAFAMLMAPYTVLGPYVGVFLDRWSRRNVLTVANLIRAALMVPVAILIAAQGPEWAFGTLALLAITINRFVLAGLSAAQPHVVEPPHLVTANSFSTTAGTIVFGTGLGSSYLIIQLFKSWTPGHPNLGYGATAGLAIPLFTISALVAWRSFTAPQLGPDESEHAKDRIWESVKTISRGMVAGFRHLWTRRGTAYAMAGQAGHRALYGVMTVFTLAVFRGHFHDPVRFPEFGDTLGWLAGIAAAGQLGSFLAAVVTPKISRSLGPGRWIVALLGLVTVTVAAIGLHVVPPVFVAAVFLINIASQGTKIVVDTSIQSNCDDDYRGRLFSLNDTVFNFSFIIGMFAGAALLPTDGFAPWLVFGVAGGYILLTSWYGWASSRYAPYGRLG
jgi:MFS family permease